MEGELRWAAAQLIHAFGLTGELTEQVIEGTPDKSFTGRLSIVVTDQAARTEMSKFESFGDLWQREREAARS